MDAILRRYARLVLEVQLKLRAGDSLSINTEERTMLFARLLAKEACKFSEQVVTIVETNHGKVVQAFPIEPEQKEIYRPPVQGVVMCHIVDLEDNPYLTVFEPNETDIDIPALATYACLSEPVFLDRRIAVPWAIVPYPGLRWARQILGNTADEEAMWALFSTLYRVTDEYAVSFWQEQGNLLEYRKNKLNQLKNARMQLIGDGWQLKARQADNTCWAGGLTTLSNGRKFASNLPMQSIHASLDCSSAEGTVHASRPFYLLGRKVCDAQFVVKQGKVVSYQAEGGIEALDAFFSVDPASRCISQISIADEDTIESRYLPISVHPLFANEITTSLVLGGFSLDTLTTQQTDEDVDASNLCRSLVRVEIPIGDSHLSLTLISEDALQHEVLAEGIYIE